MSRSAIALSRSDSEQSGVAAMSVVVTFVALELPFKIALVPNQSLIEIFAPDGPDQSLDESMRAGCAGNGLDLINLKDPKVRQPALKTKQRIVIRGKIFRHSLSQDSQVEHPAHAGSIEIGGGDSKADNPAREDVHHHHDRIALEQDRLTAEEVDAPKAIFGLPDNREPRRASAAWCRSIVLDEYPPNDILIDLEAECVRDLLGNLAAAHAWVAPLHLDHRSNQFAGGTFGPRTTGSLGAI